jgi:hypothetical protein
MAFAEGLSAASSFTLGALVAPHRGERSMATATLDLRRGSLATLSPKAFAEDVAQRASTRTTTGATTCW